jgi:hypothetical protein
LNESPKAQDGKPGDRVGLATFWLAGLAVLMTTILFGLALWVIVVGFDYWPQLMREHFAAVIGLPGAAAVAFALVGFLRQTDGPLEFEGLGFKFKGAAGQVVMWVLCFLAIAGAIKWLW